MRDPVTKLAVLDPTTVEAEICKLFPDLLMPQQNHRVALLHYLSRVTKKTRFGFNEKRIVFATNNHLFECKEDGTKKRSIKYTHIAEVLLFPDSFVVLRVPKEHDFVFKLANPSETDYLINIVRVARGFMVGSSSGISSLSVHGAKGTYTNLSNPVRLNKRDDFDYTVAEVPFIRQLDGREMAIDEFLRPPPPPAKSKGRKKVNDNPNAAEQVVLNHPLLDPAKIVTPMTTAEASIGASPPNPLFNTNPTPHMKEEIRKAAGGGDAKSSPARQRSAIVADGGVGTTTTYHSAKEAELDAKAQHLAKLQETLAQQQSEQLEQVNRLAFLRNQQDKQQAQQQQPQQPNTTTVTDASGLPGASPIVGVRWPSVEGGGGGGAATANTSTNISSLWQNGMTTAPEDQQQQQAAVGSSSTSRQLNLDQPTPTPQQQWASKSAAQTPYNVASPVSPPAATSGRINTLETELTFLRDEVQHTKTLRNKDAEELAFRREKLLDMEQELRQLKEENRSLRTGGGGVNHSFESASYSALYQPATNPATTTIPTAAAAAASNAIGTRPHATNSNTTSRDSSPAPRTPAHRHAAATTAQQQASARKEKRGMSVKDFEASVKNKELSERLILRQYQIDQKRQAVNAVLNSDDGEAYDPELVSELQDELLELVRNLEEDLRECDDGGAVAGAGGRSGVMLRSANTQAAAVRGGARAVLDFDEAATPPPPAVPLQVRMERMVPQQEQQPAVAAAAPTASHQSGGAYGYQYHPAASAPVAAPAPQPQAAAPAPPPAPPQAAPPASSAADVERQQREYAQWYYTYYYPSMVAAQQQQQHQPPSAGSQPTSSRKETPGRRRTHQDPALPFGAGGGKHGGQASSTRTRTPKRREGWRI